jgi:hypothetical protein
VQGVITAAQLDAIGGATAAVPRLSGCLLLTQCAPHLTCVLANDAAAADGMVVLSAARLVRFVDSGWSSDDQPELRILRDGEAWGVCAPDRRWWVPHHSRVPYRLVNLAADELARLTGHLDAGRPWDLFKHIQLLYLAEPGFTGGRDRLQGPPGYGALARPDRWYLTLPVRG